MRAAATDVEPDVQHLAEYYLGDPPYRAATPEAQAQRVHALAVAVQTAIDQWLDRHPLEGPARRRRWGRTA